MRKERFEELVARAIEALPEEFQQGLENVDVMVQYVPSRKQLAGMDPGMTLLGLYEGVPQTLRTGAYGMVLPDRITIFQKPIERICRSEAEMEAEIRRVVRHEIAHHFGMNEEELSRLESDDEGSNPRRL